MVLKSGSWVIPKIRNSWHCLQFLIKNFAVKQFCRCRCANCSDNCKEVSAIINNYCCTRWQDIDTLIILTALAAPEKFTLFLKLQQKSVRRKEWWPLNMLLLRFLFLCYFTTWFPPLYLVNAVFFFLSLWYGIINLINFISNLYTLFLFLHQKKKIFVF